ncbi:MAG: twin-arginine translocase subunit TatC [Anaerolineae bacterium]|nr:twin-arginine translocase subunit TatC [Anaerolineae bacterium]
MFDFLAWLPQLPISSDVALILSAFLVSLTAATIAMIRNRHLVNQTGDEDGDIGMIFENPKAIMPHILELRDRIVRALIAVVLGTVASFMLTDQVIAALAAPIGGVANIQVIRVTEIVSVWFRVALTVGIVLASPYVLAQVWIFVMTGLKPSERRAFYLLSPAAMILFLTGVAFAYYAMLPVAIPFLTTFLDFTAQPTLEDYIKFVTTVLLWVGVSFEMPLVVFGLAKLKIVNARMLAQNWRIAVVVIAILAAFITPTPDPINMGIVAAPLLVLYALSIVLALFA